MIQSLANYLVRKCAAWKIKKGL